MINTHPLYQVGCEVQIVGNLVDWDTDVDMAVVLLARLWGKKRVAQVTTLRQGVDTADINRLNTAARAVLKQPCLTGGRTDTVRPKQEPTGWTDLSDRSRLVLCNRSQELIGQACPTRRQDQTHAPQRQSLFRPSTSSFATQKIENLISLHTLQYIPYGILSTVQPKRTLAIQAGLPNHVELPERSGRLQSLKLSKLLVNPRTQLHSTYALAYFDHPPASSIPPTHWKKLVQFSSFCALTAGINRSNTAARAVLKQPCSTGGQTDTVRPKQEPTGRTDLSNRSRLVLCNQSQELIGQACPTRRQVLRSDSACPTTGQTRLFENRSNCRV
ncbi:hypothetical protein PCASD_07025 [Puccinia coronata f. sp. avenae]|uniref:Uncharacterized protein n=1 Tax=Puccinia coronata f. sp. avenae TaxID=200324 RepID=A0A2N5UZR4_9BASI|nr:hypothetical protein PCASD_07025 [Puccinia coronata f. sp. avenae]